MASIIALAESKKFRLCCTLYVLFFHFSAPYAVAQYVKLLDFGNTLNGTHPHSPPVSDGAFLYGMTSDGGTSQLGTIYKIKPDGTGYTKLLDFNGANGGNPYGSLTFVGATLYGMTSRGGANEQGIIFQINPDGTGFTILLDFTYASTGGFPFGSLISDGTFLYGMATQGGTKSYGTLFKIMPDGSGFSKLYEFDGPLNGGNPYGSLISDGTYLYGMTSTGGSGFYGTIFKIMPDGSGFAKLLDFNGTNNGSTPYGSLILEGSTLYGMTYIGGANNNGTIFKIQPDGSGFAKLLDLNRNIQGAYPTGALASDSIFLYGTTAQGGLNNYGTIFKIKPDGTSFVKMFDDDGGIYGISSEGTLLRVGTALFGVKSAGGPGFLGAIFKINTDGTGYGKLFNYETSGNSPTGSLFFDGTFLYGTTSKGGSNNNGTIFKVKPDGSGFVRLLDFSGLNGSTPYGSLISLGGYLYGMTNQGGINSYGTIFKIMPDGSGFTKFFDFNFPTNGGYPKGGLFSDGTFLYGTTSNGGPKGLGTIFKIMPDGSGFATILDFDYTANGAYPSGTLISDGVHLYGTAYQGNNNGWGTLFKIRPDGTGFVKLLDFDNTNNGSNPNGDLTYDGSFLFGMTSGGGLNSNGTIFKIKPDGTAYAKLLDFDGSTNGTSPLGSLFSDGTSLYGMTSGGGILNGGTSFKIRPDGTGFTKMLDFNNGSSPRASFVSDANFLYAMTFSGGTNGLGTLFKSSLAPFTTISNFTPADGVIGTYVTIDGTNFDSTPANNMVAFNGTAATVTASTATSLTVIVPVGATTGPIAVTALTTGISLADFSIAPKAIMINGTVQNCNIPFLPPTSTYIQNNGYKDVVETFLPANPSDKVKVSFSTFSVGDILDVYDGPTIASPLLASLSGTVLPADIVATNLGGELTFRFTWRDSFSNWSATISCQSASGATVTIATQPAPVYSVCSGATQSISTTAIGTTNITYQWQFASTLTGTYNDIVNGGGYSTAATAALSVNTFGNFGMGFYRCKINGDLAPTVFTSTAQLAVNPIPSTPTVIGASLCSGTGAVLTASGGTNGQYSWYTVASGGTAIAGEVNSSYSTPLLTATTVFYVSINIGMCESPRAPVTATVLALSAPSVAGASLCPSSFFILTAAGGTNGNYRWYTVPTGGYAIPGEVNNSYTTPSLTATTTYYVSQVNGTCESLRTPVTASVLSTGCAPVITVTKLTTQIEGKIVIDLKPLITTVGTLDINSIKIIAQTPSGALLMITSGVLTIDYSGKSFSGTEAITVEACNTYGICTQQTFTIEVAGDIIVYNGISPNGANPAFIIEYINVLPDTKINTVSIFDRWENQVWQGKNYDNTSVVFKGVSDGGSDLPTGVYFYKIDFAGGRKTKTGFISLRR